MAPKTSKPTTKPSVVCKNARMAAVKVAARYAPPNTTPAKTKAPVTPSGFFQNDFGLISVIYEFANV